MNQSVSTRVYGNIVSPYARKVYVALELKGVAYEAIDVLPHDESEAFKAVSPLGRVPGFEDDQLQISDTSVILDYLERRYPEPALYPKGLVERTKALWFEEYGDSKLDELLLHGVVMELMIKPHVYGEATDQQRLDHILADELPPALNYLESNLKDRLFLVDEQFSVADLAIVTHFINAEYAGWTVDDALWPQLAALVNRVKAEPPVATCLNREQQYLAGLTS